MRAHVTPLPPFVPVEEGGWIDEEQYERLREARAYAVDRSEDAERYIELANAAKSIAASARTHYENLLLEYDGQMTIPLGDDT